MSNNQKEVVQDLQFVAESLKEVTSGFNQQPQNFPPVGYRAAIVEDVEFDSDDDSDDDIMEKIQALEEQERDVGEIPTHIRTIHEKTLDEIEVGEIPEHIPPESPILPIAVVQHFSGNFSIARSINGKGITPGSLLADSNRNPITRVLELFGPISSPQIILKGQIPIGTELFAVVSDSEFPDPDLIAKQFRGCDASNRFDEEDPYQDFSDDEKEREYKRRMKAVKKVKPSQNNQDMKVGYPRNYPANH